MNARLSYLKSAQRFATDMLKKYTGLLKEWQVQAVLKLDAYCRAEISIKEYLNFITVYNKVLIQHEYWAAQSSWLQYEINCVLAQ